MTSRAASKTQVARRRIEFRSADAARFNAMREEWRVAASGGALPKVAHKLASLLPGYVSREYGYAFPTDEQLAEVINATPRTVGRGMKALDAAGLIERQTMVKRDEKGEAIGRLRRIYLTLRATPGERTEVNGQPEVNGQNRVGERTTVVRIYPDRTTPDNKSSIERKVSSYAPAREGYPTGYSGDDEFLDVFDRALIEIARLKPAISADLERLAQQAFDKTTDSSELFMPFHWRDVRALRSGDTAEWFRRRADQLIDRRAA
ncbi:helix-turn-helix domain-containing protein [Aerobium aerolatum]|uniref:Helix-turn-helix domain-containing protein n=1 Tax=Aquamicrobium aerolatum DSM 21857 TaxID=1121003 RepID=A0A1I3SH15_9HYPH|nr:helix-turn-helix domain-containing protein [Aquamicrobium aerolatum]SFJ57352.1 hypothetical protein SAMN03080618_03354 [Aquamicrobium aerolatum DSM 21857]